MHMELDVTVVHLLLHNSTRSERRRRGTGGEGGGWRESGGECGKLGMQVRGRQKTAQFWLL